MYSIYIYRYTISIYNKMMHTYRYNDIFCIIISTYNVIYIYIIIIVTIILIIIIIVIIIIMQIYKIQ